MSELIGKQLGAYEIREQIGRGGMATVYKAYHAPTDRMVAVKVMLPFMRTDETFAKRFEREAQLLASLQHIHIVPVFDYGEQDGITYLVMPLLPGETLQDAINNQPLALEKTAKLLRQLGSALDYAHSRGLLHRDIKPGNIMLDASGNALLADFGLIRLIDDSNNQSKLTADSAIIGTPSYMSPEQGQGEDLTPASDLYALGVVLYEMVTGKVPFDAETPISVILKHITEPVSTRDLEQLDLPPAVIEVVVKALHKEPEYRYQSAVALVDALDAALTGQPAPNTVVNQMVETRVAPSVQEPEEAEGESSEVPPVSLDDLQSQNEKSKKKQSPNHQPRRLILAGGGVILLLMVLGLGFNMAGIIPFNNTHEALLFEIEAHDGAVYALDYGGISTQLLSGGADDTAKVWLTDTQELATLIEGHTSDVLGVAFHPDLPRAATGGRDSIGYQWDTDTGDRLITNFEGGAIYQTVYSPQGTYLGYTTGGTVSWNTADMEGASFHYLSDLSESIFRSMSFSFDETLVAVGDESGVIQVLDRERGQVNVSFDIRDSIVFDLDFHPDGTRLAVATDDGNITIWRTEDGSMAALWDAEAGAANAVAYSPSGRILAAAYEDGTVRLWQINTGEVNDILTGHDAPVLSMAFNSDGSRLATGDENGTILIWRVPEV